MSFALVFSSVLFAQDYVQEIIVNESIEKLRPRSFLPVSKPRVFFDASSQELSISLSERMAQYDVEIADENGVVVYSGNLTANGTVHYYSLPNISEGYYTLKISNQAKTYTGEFWL